MHAIIGLLLCLIAGARDVVFECNCVYVAVHLCIVASVYLEPSVVIQRLRECYCVHDCVSAVVFPFSELKRDL